MIVDSPSTRVFDFFVSRIPSVEICHRQNPFRFDKTCAECNHKTMPKRGSTQASRRRFQPDSSPRRGSSYGCLLPRSDAKETTEEEAGR